MAKRSFFSDLRFIEAAISRQKVSERGEAVFETLVEFVEDCRFTRSKSYKFLCKNWRLDYDSLEKLWAAEGGKAKGKATLRVQASCVSQMLYSLFPTFSRELFVLDMGDDGFLEIETTVSIVGQTSGYPQELFVSELTDYMVSAYYKGDWKVEDCLDTAAKLKPLLRTDVHSYLDRFDRDQVKYILSILCQPLFDVHSVQCNTEKLALLKAIGVSNTQVGQSGQDGQDKVAIREMKVEVPEKTPYNLAFTKKMADILTECAGSTMSIAETKKFLKMPETERDKRKQKLAKVLYLFTEDGLRSQLSHYSPIEISEVLNGDYPVNEDETAYKFKK